MNLEGRTIGNYQILDEVGRGGMAVVYRAYQPSLNRYVAIKVLPPALAFNAQFLERFQREARAVAGLRHPNIVVIYDVGQEGQSGGPALHYIVMEYLEGVTLKELLEREGPLPPERAARIVDQVAAALDYAHQRGFVHRDVKPSNIFVCAGDQVTLTDFGIAKVVAETDRLTHTGMLIGTPEYMSPEQARAGEIDHRTDVYSLGVVLYEMLTGRVPFSGAAPHAVLHDVIYETPPPPRRLNPRLSTELEAVVHRALAKRPEARFQHGKEMASAVRRAVGNDRAKRTPVPGAQQRAGTKESSPVLLLMGGAAAVLLLIFGVLLTAMASRPDESSRATATLDAGARETPSRTAVAGVPGTPGRPSETGETELVATNTPASPTILPTATLVPTSTVDTHVLTATVSPNVPPPTSTPWPYSPVTLIQPWSGELVRGQVTFRWDSGAQDLSLQDAYRLLLWAVEDETPEQPLNPDTIVTVTEWEVALDALSLVPDEEYYWTVVIVDLDTLDPRSDQATPRTFVYTGPADGNSQ